MYYGADRHDSVIDGFDDKICYELAHETLYHPLINKFEVVDKTACVQLFHDRAKKNDKTMY